MVNKRNFLFIGITGGVGSGKSLAGHILREKGYKVIDSDQISRKITLPGSPALQKITFEFGNRTLLDDGTLNRKYLRSLIINDSIKREQLEKITHPEIQKSSLEEAAEYAAKTSYPIIFYEAPLLYEANAHLDKDYTLCITAHDEIRIKRIMERDQCSQEEAEKIISSQWPQDKKATLSDFVITNNESKEIFYEKVDAILSRLLMLKSISKERR